MSSTFFGLNIGWSALNAYSASTNTAANNIANANTPGYSKQVTNLMAKGALRNHCYGTLGSGVDAESITQLRNTYYDVKYWTNNSNTGQYDKKIYYMSQFQNLFNDDEESIKGFSSIYSSMFNTLESLKGDSGNTELRNQFINNTEAFLEYFNNMSSNLKGIQSDCNQEVRAMVSKINSTAQKISILNDKINTIEIQGAHANELRDQRASLIDELSAIVPIEIEETQVKNSNYPEMYTGATNFRVTLEGQVLVDGDQYFELACVSREDKVHQNDIDGLYDIVWKETGNDFNASSESMSGQLKAVLDIRDGNNRENLQGTLSMINGSSVIIENPNITSVDAMNMPPTGQITIGNRTYNYSRFEMYLSVDEEGNEVCTYQFDLSDDDLTTLSGKVGKPVSIGKPVDSRGIPYYMTQMNEFLRSFCRKMNDIQKYGTEGADENNVPINGGTTLTNEPMGTYIVSKNPSGSENAFTDTKYADGRKGTQTTYKSDGSNYYFMTADNVTVNQKSLDDPNYLATTPKNHVDQSDESASTLVDQMLELQSKVVTYRGAAGDQFLQYIITDITVDMQEADILYSNYFDVGNTIDTYRMSISSVDEDEEALDLIKFQNAYNMASKIISTLNQMYDRLITQTGV